MGWNINRALPGTTGIPYQSVQGAKYFSAPGPGSIDGYRHAIGVFESDRQPR
jgi:hypothetical protein